MATMQAVARPRKTVEDLWALGEDVRAELIDGEIYVTPAPIEPHQRAVTALIVALSLHIRGGAGGQVYTAPFDVHLPTGDVVQPDVIWVSPARAGIVRECVYGAPDLLVEILSPSNSERDRIVKRSLYARSGVREYWIVDPEARGVEVFVLEAGAFVPAGWFTSGTSVVSKVLPGLSVPVDEVCPPRSSPPEA
jgi:Uma2 family endonuclease